MSAMRPLLEHSSGGDSRPKAAVGSGLVEWLLRASISVIQIVAEKPVDLRTVGLNIQSPKGP